MIMMYLINIVIVIMIMIIINYDDDDYFDESQCPASYFILIIMKSLIKFYII